LRIAGEGAGLAVAWEWLHTSSVTSDFVEKFQEFDGFWCVPASPYENMDGALKAIQYARENGIAFLGTCGGYQHAILEFARNVLGFEEADNAEVNPETTFPLISPLSCALVEQEGGIQLVEGSKIAGIYQAVEVSEMYRCRYGFNPEYKGLFKNSELIISGYDADQEPRVIEHKNHPFFIGVAFQPERSALKQKSHPLISAFVRHAIKKTATA
jgi:CTP synthase (UTP-ammonia lyase)